MPGRAREPAISAAEVEARVREVLGDKLERIEFKSRKGRSERITWHLAGGSFTFTSRSTDPDAVRKCVLQFLDDCMATANEVVRKIVDAERVGEDDEIPERNQ